MEGPLLRQFSAFRASLRAWTFRLWDDMIRDVGRVRTLQYAPIRSGGDVVGTMREVTTQSWPDRYNYDAFRLPEWASVMEAWRADQLLASHLGRLVGTAIMQHTLTEQELGFAFWPTLRMTAHWQQNLDPLSVREEEFEAIYEPVARYFADDHREVVVLVPIFGLVTDGPLEVEPGVAFDRFTRDEMQLLIDRGIVRDQFRATVNCDNAPEPQRHGLRRVMRVSKIVEGRCQTADPTEERVHMLSQPVKDRVRAARTLGCCLDGDVVPQPFVGRTAGWNPGGGEMMVPSTIFAYYAWDAKPTALTRSDHGRLRHVWRLMGHPDLDNSVSLRIAVDRLAWLGTRPDVMDVLVDTAIASEAFFRSGEQRHVRQIGKRIARRASSFIDGADFGMNAPAVRSFFLEASEVRNAAVHRGEHPGHVSYRPAESLSFAAFVRQFGRLVRRALITHLMACDVPRSPTWIDAIETPRLVDHAFDRVATRGSESLAFCVAFARFEFALKECFEVRADRHGMANPNWPIFEECEPQLDLVADPQTKEAIRYLLSDPPKVQYACGDGRAKFGDKPLRGDGAGNKAICDVLRRVRNDLFHGGKEPYTDRDRHLVKAGLQILEAYLALHPDLKSAFDR
jgi:hypothetical protein